MSAVSTNCRRHRYRLPSVPEVEALSPLARGRVGLASALGRRDDLVPGQPVARGGSLDRGTSARLALDANRYRWIWRCRAGGAHGAFGANVRTGRGHVFRNSAITPEVLLASACLPTLFQAIEINGEPYWEGGYSGNPTITPLVRECTSRDRILFQINPVDRPGTPRTGATSSIG
jgi:predicted acylesterase/phospholipase RssA